ncbi:MAG: hypothetical protein ACSLE0_07630, partial [Chitinophagaceae bacterium]
MKTSTDHLKKFASFLSRHSHIDGYMGDNGDSEVANGAAKQDFKKLGKKAFRELAEYLGLTEYEVDFNPGGPAVSGDLRLMGMFTPDAGIYISMDKDGMQSGILYRSINHMKDYTGGNNNYFSENDLNYPEKIKDKVFSLLKLNQSLSKKSLSELNQLPNVSVVKIASSGSEDMEEKSYIGDNDITDAKYAWEMTPLEYQQIKAIQKTGSPNILDAKDRREHEKIIEWAVKQGKIVPEEILESYPDLKELKPDTTPEKQGFAKSTFDLLTGDEWFKQHPEKILGEQYQTTDRFNKPVTKVKGSVDNIIQGINVPMINDAKEQTEALQTEIKEPLQQLMNYPEKKNNIERVINETKKVRAEKALKKLSGERDKYEDGCPEEYLCFDEVMQQYNKGISEDEVKAWIWYKRKTKGYNDEKIILNAKNGWSKYVVPLGDSEKHLNHWLKAGIVCYYKGSFIPSVLYFAE